MNHTNKTYQLYVYCQADAWKISAEQSIEEALLYIIKEVGSMTFGIWPSASPRHHSSLRGTSRVQWRDASSCGISVRSRPLTEVIALRHLQCFRPFALAYLSSAFSGNAGRSDVAVKPWLVVEVRKSQPLFWYRLAVLTYLTKNYQWITNAVLLRTL